MSAKESENAVRSLLYREFDQSFEERELEVGEKVNGETAKKKFDAVSKDGAIIAMVKDYSAINLNGNRTRLARVLQDMVYLHLAPNADHKYLFLSPAFYEWFAEVRDGSVIPGVEVRCIPRI